MAQEAPPLDADQMPDVSRLVHEVNRTGRPRLIHAGGEIARLSPVRSSRRRNSLTPEQREAILRQTFGAWQGIVDADRLKQELNDLQRDDSATHGL